MGIVVYSNVIYAYVFTCKPMKSQLLQEQSHDGPKEGAVKSVFSQECISEYSENVKHLLNFLWFIYIFSGGIGDGTAFLTGFRLFR